VRRDAGRDLAASVAIAAILLLVIVGVLALAWLIWPI
jgi:hypothetical protein